MILSWLVCGAILALYWSHPSAFWNFDGVACAAAIEYGDWTYFFHSQHLIYGFLGWGFWKFLGLFVEGIRGISALQCLAPIFSAIGMIALWKTAAMLTKDIRLGLLITGFMSVTAVFWVWSIEPQVYSLGFMGLAWATYYLLSPRASLGRVGLWHGIAVLGHLMHILWIIPAVFFIWKRAKQTKQDALPGLQQYVGTMGAVIVLSYVAVFLAVLLPSGKSWKWISVWMKGSAGLTADRSFAWHWSGWSGPWEWLQATPSIFWGSFWPYAMTPTLWTWVMTGISVIAVALMLLGLRRHSFPLVIHFSFLWIAIYGILLSTWEPTTLCYRMTDILPLGILLSVGIANLPKPFMARSIGAAAFLFTAALTLQTRIRPMQDPNNNIVYTEVMNFHRTHPPETPFVTSNSMARLYMLYFAGRNAYLQS